MPLKPVVVPPATTILPSGWTAIALSHSMPSLSTIATPSPPPNVGSGAPSTVNRMTTPSPLTAVEAATTVLPSGWTAIAPMSSPPPESRIARPAAP